MGFFSNLFGSSQEGKKIYLYQRHDVRPLRGPRKRSAGSRARILKAKVSLMDKRATVHVTDEADDKAMFKAVVNAGYSVDKITDTKNKKASSLPSRCTYTYDAVYKNQGLSFDRPWFFYSIFYVTFTVVSAMAGYLAAFSALSCSISFC